MFCGFRYVLFHIKKWFVFMKFKLKLLQKNLISFILTHFPPGWNDSFEAFKGQHKAIWRPFGTQKKKMHILLTAECKISFSLPTSEIDHRFICPAGVVQNFVVYPWWNTNLTVKAPHVSIKPLSEGIPLGIGCRLPLGSLSLVPLQS